MSQTENKNRISTPGKSFSIKVEDFIIGIRRFGWLCIVLSVLLGAVSFVKEQVQYVPMYTAESTFTVST